MKSTKSPKGKANKHQSPFPSLDAEDQIAITGFLEKKDPRLAHVMKKFSGEIFIAGGFIVSRLINTKVNDIDVFGREHLCPVECSKNYALSVAKKFMLPTKFTISVPGPFCRVQFVEKAVYHDARICISSFDFSICQSAVWFEDGKWRSVCSPQFYPDLKAKRLRYINQNRPSDSPGASVYRAAKYVSRGFTLSRNDKVALFDRFFQNYQRVEAIKNDGKI